MPLSTKCLTGMPAAAAAARKQRGAAGEGQHVAQECDWAHLGSIGGGGLAGEVADECRRRGRGGTSAAVQIPAR
jgi:hypothetical protein